MTRYDDVVAVLDDVREAQIVFAALATRLSGIDVAAERAERTSSVAFRGLRSLPVTLC